MAHVRRDRQRGNKDVSGVSYREAIHAAVIESGGFDAYTGEKLDWTTISQYDNEESRLNGRDYKRKFCLLPTVDHVGDGTGPADFKICSWRTNDAKNALALPDFISLCCAVLQHQGYDVKSHS